MEQNFSNFMMSVPESEQGMVLELDRLLREHGFTSDIKLAKNGYVVSYIKKEGKTQTTIANFVFRKSGMKIRIYASNVAKYQEFLDTLPKKMKAEIIKAGDCKRLFDPTACNQRCKMGLTFQMDGKTYKKCRYMAFMPTLCKENDPYIEEFVKRELCEIQ